MDPVSMMMFFFGKVAGFVKSGIGWRRMINGYETEKARIIPEMYQYKIFPLDFVPVRRSSLEFDNTTPGSPGDYAHAMIKVKDIYPFILSAHSGFLVVRSFKKDNPSAFDNVKLNISAGYVIGNDGKLVMIDANHVAYDKPGNQGYLNFYTDPSSGAAVNRKAHVVNETGLAYALAPNVKPNIITKSLVLFAGPDAWKYGIIIF